MQERADIVFMDEMRFQMTRQYAISYIIGLNATMFFYSLTHMHNYRFLVSLPVCYGVFLAVRNLVMTNSVDAIYYPIRPLYQNVWNSIGKKAPTVNSVTNLTLNKDQKVSDLFDKEHISEKDREKLRQ